MPFVIEKEAIDIVNTEIEEEIEEKSFISDSSDAVGIISTVLAKSPQKKLDKIEDIKKYIRRIFSLFSDIAINEETEYYSGFIKAADKLKEIRRYTILEDKTIIGIGGHFSAGKSKFIKSIAGIGDLLPEATTPSTSIPTYIIKGKSDKYTGTNIFGMSANLREEQVKAISHEFYENYKVGFAAFLENLILTCHKWSLPENIALIDTPGIGKADNKQNENFSDKEKAIQQLNVADHIIWLMEIHDGVLKDDDIDFLQRLNPQKPILIVINKADTKPLSIITEVLDIVENTVIDHGINCYGISAYSSLEKKEFDKRIINGEECDALIEGFIESCSDSNRTVSIMDEFKQLENDFMQEIDNYSAFADKNEIVNMINASVQVMDIMSLAMILKDINSERSAREHLRLVCKSMFKVLNKKIKNIVKENRE